MRQATILVTIPHKANKTGLDALFVGRISLRNPPLTNLIGFVIEIRLINYLFLTVLATTLNAKSIKSTGAWAYHGVNNE